MPKPCLGCGVLVPESRCKDCTPKRAKPADSPHYDGRWKRLSAQARKASPFCEQCGAIAPLEADHIVPVSVAPDWAYRIENVRVLCRTHNRTKATAWTQQEYDQVAALIAATDRRRADYYRANLCR